MDRILRSPGTERFLILLADSGMGKTASLSTTMPGTGVAGRGSCAASS